MSALQLDELASFYNGLLSGKPYSTAALQSASLQMLFSDWFNHQYDRDDDPGIESLPIVSIKYDQIHTSMHDALAEEDSLGRGELVKAMASILSDKENSQHQTIGLLGDWGAGKSTYVHLLKAALKEQEETKFLFAEFNAWEYEHTDNMQAGVAREALHGLVDGLGWWEKLWFALRFSLQEKPWHVVLTLGTTLALFFGTIFGAGWLDDSWKEGASALIGVGGLAVVAVLGKFFRSLQKI